ncbi:MAG TPA: helix-turn-helix transcriptional regulator [Candidatus Tectomicrobia bacterium]
MNCIKAVREAQGIDQKSFAEAMQVDRVTIWRWENSHTPLLEPTITKIAQYFQVMPAALFPDFLSVPANDKEKEPAHA